MNERKSIQGRRWNMKWENILHRYSHQRKRPHTHTQTNTLIARRWEFCHFHVLACSEMQQRWVANGVFSLRLGIHTLNAREKKIQKKKEIHFYVFLVFVVRLGCVALPINRVHMECDKVFQEGRECIGRKNVISAIRLSPLHDISVWKE